MASKYDKYDTGLKKGELLNNSRFEIIEAIGQGGFGYVYSANDNQNNREKCAIKMIDSLLLPRQDLVATLEKIDFLIKSESKHIVKYIGHFKCKERPCVATLFYKDGDLDQFITERKLNKEKLDTIDILYWSKQILEGLDYLHSNGIIHRGLKPSNIYFNGISLVLGDLGLAKSMKELKNSETYLDTYYYMSPEVINRKNCSFETDIWSFGCVLYELVEFEKAFYGESEFHISQAILENSIPQISGPYLNSILNKCLKRKPTERANTKVLIELVKEGVGDMRSIDKEIIDLNNNFKHLKKENKKGMKVFLDKIKKIQMEFEKIKTESKAKSEYIQLMTKLASYEEEEFKDCEKAILIHREILDIKKNFYPDNHSSIIDTLNNIGKLYSNSSDYNKAKEFFDEALEIGRKSLSENHESIADTLYNLGSAYDDLGDEDKAKELYEEALEMYRKNLPENHDSIADTLHNFGLLYSAYGDKIRAEEFYEKASKMRRKTLPENHSSIADTIDNHELVYDNKNKENEFNTKNFGTKRKAFSENNPSKKTFSKKSKN